MPLMRSNLAEAASANDRVVDAGNSIPALLMSLGVDPTSAVYVAEQRALRVALRHSGVSAEALRDYALAGIPFAARLTDEQERLMPVYASLWIDGLAVAQRASLRL